MRLPAEHLLPGQTHPHAPAKIQSEIEHTHDTWRFDGKRNLLFLAVIVGAVFVTEKYFLRELLMLAAAGASFALTPKQVHESNHFNFGPIKEVAFLFLGIFATMLPALDYLEEHGRDIELTKPAHYYYAAGALSAVLDNAPTYVNFLKLAEVRAGGIVEEEARTPDATVAEKSSVQHLLDQTGHLVVAISLGAVFFGAMTYIGNGPNFMVKSIADSSGVHTPTFFGYIFKYSLPVLLPILALTAWLFL